MMQNELVLASTIASPIFIIFYPGLHAKVRQIDVKVLKQFQIRDFHLRLVRLRFFSRLS